MSLLTIINPNNPILRKKSKNVMSFDDQLQDMIDDMIETMLDASGVGLAAPQVGYGFRLFVAYVDEEPEEIDDNSRDIAPGIGRMHVMINPRITKMSQETVIKTEGCLSIPGYLGDVARSSNIVVKYLDRFGQKRKLQTFGWMARVIQHEYDHLDGVLFIDKAEKIWMADDNAES